MSSSCVSVLFLLGNPRKTFFDICRWKACCYQLKEVAAFLWKLAPVSPSFYREVFSEVSNMA